MDSQLEKENVAEVQEQDIDKVPSSNNSSVNVSSSKVVNSPLPNNIAAESSEPNNDQNKSTTQPLKEISNNNSVSNSPSSAIPVHNNYLHQQYTSATTTPPSAPMHNSNNFMHQSAIPQFHQPPQGFYPPNMYYHRYNNYQQSGYLDNRAWSLPGAATSTPNSSTVSHYVNAGEISGSANIPISPLQM